MTTDTILCDICEASKPEFGSEEGICAACWTEHRADIASQGVMLELRDADTGETSKCWLSDFRDNEQEDMQDEARGLAVGASFLVGGAAAPVWVKRVS